MNEQEERTEWAIPPYACKHYDGVFSCNHPDAKERGCNRTMCILKVTGANEKVIGMIEAQKDWNPYPADVFLPKNDKQWKEFHAALKKGGIIGDGYLGCVARDAYNLALDRLVKILREQGGK